MLIDMAVLTVFSWLVAKALNMVFFKGAPASKFIAWTLTFGYFICGVILASVVKIFRGAAISKSLGISMSAQNPMDMGTAFIMALVFYQVLNRASKNSANSRVKADSAAPDLSIHTPAIASRLTATSTQYAIRPPHALTDQPTRATMSSSLVHQSLKEGMAVDESAIYTAIANELESGAIDKGLWTRLFAENDGDESKTKAAYIRQRANQMLARNDLFASQGSPEASFNVPLVETALSGDSGRSSAPANLTSPANYRNGLMVVAVLIVSGALLYLVTGKPRFSNANSLTTPALEAGAAQPSVVVDEDAIERRVRRAITEETLDTFDAKWREIIGLPDSAGNIPNTKFRQWLAKQPKEYQDLVNSTYNASVLVDALSKFKAAQAR